MNGLFQLSIDYSTLVAYVAFSSDLIVQIVRIWKRKSSADVSSKGVVLRLIGSAVILIKLIGVGDPYLIIGQIILTLTVATYLYFTLRYRKG